MNRLNKSKANDHHLLLSPVATMALMIDESGIVWPEDRPLNVLLLNPGKLDYLDGGQWYRFLPALFGHDKTVSITACGGTGAKGQVSREAVVLKDSDPIANYEVIGSVAEALSASDREYDLAVSFTDFAYGDALLESLKAMRAREIPLYFTSFSSTHALFNHLILKAHQSIPEPVLAVNPFALASKRNGEQWNRVVSKVQAAHLPDVDAEHDTEYTAVLDVVSSVVLHAHRAGNPNQKYGVGEAVRDQWVHTFDSIAVNVLTGCVLDLDTDQRLGCLSEYAFDALEGFDDAWDETDRLVWAAFGRHFVAIENIVPFTQRSVA